MYWGKRYGFAPSKMRLRRQDNATDTTGDMDGDDSANPNSGIVYNDGAEDASYQVSDADFTAQASQDIAGCSVDLTNPDQPIVNCDGQTDGPLDDADPAVDPIFTEVATSTTSTSVSITSSTPPPVPTCPISNDDHWPSCDECPNS